MDCDWPMQIVVVTETKLENCMGFFRRRCLCEISASEYLFEQKKIPPNRSDRAESNGTIFITKFDRFPCQIAKKKTSMLSGTVNIRNVSNVQEFRTMGFCQFRALLIAIIV